MKTESAPASTAMLPIWSHPAHTRLADRAGRKERLQTLPFRAACSAKHRFNADLGCKPRHAGPAMATVWLPSEQNRVTDRSTKTGPAKISRHASKYAVLKS